jgi:hypothetical protein
MKKPEDYDVYFNPDGSKKNPPNGLNDFKEIVWYRRQNNIELSLMGDEEREQFLARRRLLYRRWASESNVLEEFDAIPMYKLK